MRKRNRLHGLRPPAQEIQDRINRRTVGRGKNACGWIGGLTNSGPWGAGERRSQQHERATNRRNNDKSASPTFPNWHPKGQVF